MGLSMRLFLLPIFVLMSGCATTETNFQSASLDPTANFAVYVAKVVASENVGTPVCSGNTLCPNHLYDVVLKPQEIIAGNPTIDQQAFRLAQNSPYLDNVRLLVRVTRENSGANWQVQGREALEVRGCLSGLTQDEIDTSQFSHIWDVNVPEAGSSEGEMCFSRLAS